MSSQRDELGTLVKDVRSGLETALPKGVRSLMVGNTVFSINNLAKIVKGYDDLWRTPEDLSAAFHAAVQARESKVPTVREFMTDLKHAIVAALGSRNPDLLHFGIQPKKDRKKPTSEERAHAAARARATRKERHTMGRRQKEAISGAAAITPAETLDAPGEKKPQA